MQKALFKSNLDDELTKYLDMELEMNNVESNLTNMLAVVQHIFDEFYPRCVCCGDTEDYQRNPHDLNNSDCLAEGIADEEPEPKGQESTTEKRNNTEEKEEGVFTGRIDLVGPSVVDYTSVGSFQQN